MTLRERLHRQIDQLDAHQLVAIDMLLAQITRRRRPGPAAAPVSVPPYVRAQHMMAGHRGFGQDIIDRTECETLSRHVGLGRHVVSGLKRRASLFNADHSQPASAADSY